MSSTNMRLSLFVVLSIVIIMIAFLMERYPSGTFSGTNTTPAGHGPTFAFTPPDKGISTQGNITGETKKDFDRRMKQTPIVKEVDPYVDRNLNVKLIVGGNRDELRAIRYGVASKPREFRVTFAKGGKPHQEEVMMDVITATIQRMPHLKGTINFKLQILETIAVESSMGKTIDTGSGDLGICQIRLDTAKDLLGYLKERHPDAYQAVNDLRDPNMDLRENLVRNIPFSIALCGSIYWWRIPDIFHKGHTQTDRGLMWKVVYNTHKGAGRIKDYCDRAEDMIDYNRIYLSVASR